MKSTKIEITYGISRIILDVIDHILYEEVRKTKRSKPVKQEREIPFNLRTKLAKTRMVLEKDAQEFESFKNKAILEIWEQEEDQEKRAKLLEEKLIEIMSYTVVHSVEKCTMKEIESLTFGSTVPLEALGLFSAYMINDTKFLENLDTKVAYIS